MDKAEIRQINEINEYKEQLIKTKSNKRKKDILKQINTLERELKEYRRLRYEE